MLIQIHESLQLRSYDHGNLGIIHFEVQNWWKHTVTYCNHDPFLSAGPQERSSVGAVDTLGGDSNQVQELVDVQELQALPLPVF